MKYLDTIFDEMPNLGRRRPGSAIRERSGVDVDEDLFSPAPRHARPLPANDFDDRPWPTLELPAKPGPHPLERKCAEQERELALRCTQVADLYQLQERQTAELQVAYAEIDRLTATFAELEVTAARNATTSAERKQAVTALYQENAVLRSKLAAAEEENAALTSKMLTVETMFNDREMVITTTLEQADLLKAELAAANDEKTRLSAALARAESLNESDRDSQTAVIDDLKRKLEALFADHGVQIKTRERLARRCDELAKNNAALESTLSEARGKLAENGEHTSFLEAVLRAERETSEARIKELTGKLEQERLRRATSEGASKAMRQEMATLLKELAARRRPSSEAEPRPPGQLNAA